MKDRIFIKSEYGDDSLLEIIFGHPKHFNKEELKRTHEILVERGYSHQLEKLFETHLKESDDDDLIQIVESEPETFHPLFTKIAETFLLDRGYQIENSEHNGFQRHQLPEEFKPLSDYDPQDALEARFYVLSDTPYYIDKNCREVIGTLSAGALYSYKREIIRNGRKLLLIRLKEQNSVYVEINPSTIFICDQFIVKKHPIDIVLLQLDNYNQLVSSPSVSSTKPSKKIEQIIQSNIRKEGSIVIVTIKDIIMPSTNKMMSLIHKAYFTPLAFDHISLGCMLPQSIFYNLEPIQSGKVTKIMTADGTEALLLSHPDMYKKMKTPLEKSTGCLVTFSSIILSLALIIVAFQHTDYFIVSTLFIIPIVFLVQLFIGVPFYIIFSELNKRL